MTTNHGLELRLVLRALTDMYWFSKQPWQHITEERFDQCFDIITALLEEANNCKHRLVTPKGEGE